VNILRRFALPFVAVAVTALLLPSVTQRVRAQEVEDNVLIVTESQPAGELKTVAVVAISPYASLMNDIKFLGSLAGKPEMAQMLEGGLALFTQGKGADALQKDKPWGAVVASDGNSFLPVIALPVKELDDLVAVATAYGAQVADGEDGAKELILPNQQSLFVKQGGAYALCSTSTTALAKVKQDPQPAFEKLLSDYDIAANVNLSNMPEMYRQFALQAMQAGMQQQLVKQDDETDEEFDMRRQMAEGQLKQMEQMINELDSLTLGLSIDDQQQRLFFDFSYFVKPDTKLAKQLAAYENTSTNFAGFYQPDLAATGTFAMKGDPSLFQEDVAQFDAMVTNMRQQANKAIDDSDDLTDEPETRDALKDAVSDLIDAFASTIKTGRMDGGFAADMSEDSLTVVAGLFVKDPAKLEEGLKKLDAAGAKRKEGRVTEVKWNAASHAGVNFHTITVPVPADQEAPRRMFGEKAEIAVGIGEEAVYLAIGRNNLESVNKAIDASAAERGKKVPPFEFAISLAPIIETAATKAEDADQKAIMESVADMLRNEAQGRDHIRMVGHPVPNGLRYRVEAEEGVLRAIGKGTQEAQRRKMQALQQQQ
jgi:hypothetical protein